MGLPAFVAQATAGSPFGERLIGLGAWKGELTPPGEQMQFSAPSEEVVIVIRWVQRICMLVVVTAALLACGPGAAGVPAAPENPNLILATTTSTQDSGLLDVLVPMFEQQTGYVVKTVAVGTGAALAMAEAGNADVLLVHAPAAEQALMDGGYGRDRMLVMHNDFVLVGPAADPAGIEIDRDAADALASIAATEALFVSRGDDSGTNKKELGLWSGTAYDPNSSKPEWYVESGQGMGATLIIASEKSAYTLTDRATFLANQGSLALEIMVEGDPSLLNVYHVIAVNPEKWPDANYRGALAFVQFMTDRATQSVIADFGVEQFGQPLFIPDADKTDADFGLE
ncbi:MAG: substrate-binding domain-containing protein [Anaerolineales bacterium]